MKYLKKIVSVPAFGGKRKDRYISLLSTDCFGERSRQAKIWRQAHQHLTPPPSHSPGSTPTMRSLLLLTALTFFLALSFVLTRGDHTSQHALDEPRAQHCISRNAVRSLQFCLCLNNLDLEFFETVRSSSCSTITCDDAPNHGLTPLCGVCFAMQRECECHLFNETVSCRYTDSGMPGLHPLQ
jgi:hypothetical protein